MNTISLFLCVIFFAASRCQEEPPPTDDYVDPIIMVREQREKDEQFRQQETQTEYPNGVNVIPGEAELDYPVLSKVEKSSFSCIGRPVGFYADTELRCQVWHICDVEQRQQSFLCTNGTTYNQEKRVCDWWYNVNCDPNVVNRYYEQNKELYTDEEVHYVRNKEAAQKGSEQFITKATPTKSTSELLFIQHQQREQNRKVLEANERNSYPSEIKEERAPPPPTTPTTIIISRGSAPPIIVRGPQQPQQGERKSESQNLQQRRRPSQSEQETQNIKEHQQAPPSPSQFSRNAPPSPSQFSRNSPPSHEGLRSQSRNEENERQNFPENFRPSAPENYPSQQPGSFRPQQQEEFRPSPNEQVRALQPENFRPVQPQYFSSQQKNQENYKPQQQTQQRPETVRPPPPPQPQHQQRPKNQRSQQPPPPPPQPQQQRSENQRSQPLPPQQPPKRPENFRSSPPQNERSEGFRPQENPRQHYQQPQEAPRQKSSPPPSQGSHPAPKSSPSFSQDPNVLHASKFRHSTPRKHNVKFAASSRSSDDEDNKERQVPAESQHPRFAYNVNDFYKSAAPQNHAYLPIDFSSSGNQNKNTRRVDSGNDRIRTTPEPSYDGPTSQTIPIITEPHQRQPQQESRQNKQRQNEDILRFQLSAGLGGGPPQKQFARESQLFPNSGESEEVELQTAPPPQRTRPTAPVVILVSKPTPTAGINNKKVQVTHKFVVVKTKPTPEPAEWSGKNIILNKNDEPIGTRVFKENYNTNQKKVVSYAPPPTPAAAISKRTYAPFAENSEEEELIRQQFLEGSFEYGVKNGAYRKSYL